MKSRVRIGYQADFAPFMADDGGPSGLVIDAWQPAIEALHGAGYSLVWRALTLETQEAALAFGEVDVLAGLGRTPERVAAGIHFGPTLVRTGGALFGLGAGSDRPARITTPATGPLVDPTRRAFPDAVVVVARDYPDALSLVLAGQADAAALNFHVGAEISERDHPGRFKRAEEPFAAVDLAAAFTTVDEAVSRLIGSVM